MPLFILTETSAGYALLKAKDKKLLTRENLGQETETAEQVCSLLKLKEFHKFESAAAALEEVSALVEGKVTSKLASLLDSIKDEKKASLAVADPKLANAINKLPQLSLAPISDASTVDLYRAIRNHLPSLIPGLLPSDISTMSLGLSHSLSRHKLKFSPDKVDTMIVQAIALLDDLDKELNIYAMRVKEWYGWHFPEMGRIVNDNLAYARVILTMGMRTSAASADLTDVLPEEIEAAVKAAAEVSMGTEITSDDLDNIKALAEQVVAFTEYRQQLSSYLSARMAAIAPNLTALVGDLVGARLISHAGSLMNLAKSPASTIQILGAEKALFRALKTKHDTPKYGLIYHASLIGQATGKNKGKIARVLAAKAAIGLRVDALADWSAEGEGRGDEATEEERSALGVESRLKIERRLAALEGKPIRSRGAHAGSNGVQVQPGKWEVKEARKYNPDADGLMGDEPAAAAAAATKGTGAAATKLIEEVNDVAMTDASDDEDSSADDESGEEEKKKEKEEGNSGDEEDETMEEAPSHAKAHRRENIPEKKTNGAEAHGDQSDEDDDDEEDDIGDHDLESDKDEHDGDHDDLSTETPAPAATASARRTSRPQASNSDDKSETISTVSADTPDSPDSPTQQETNWQSSILGNTKVAKKARKKERHERRLALSEERARKRTERNAKLARRLDRKERRTARSEQLLRRDERDFQTYGTLAKQAGLSITRYKRKLERGEITFQADGTPVAISKKVRKAAERAAMGADKAKAVEVVGHAEKKRKRDREDHGEDGKKDRSKKKKKSKELA